MSQSAVVGPQPVDQGLAGALNAAAARLTLVPLWVWAMLAAAIMAAQGIAFDYATLSVEYRDPDDAMRMVQVREFLASGHWFDTTVPRLAGPGGMLSHWSRLIDLPLALLMSLARLFLSADNAELAVRLVWPFLLLAPMLLVVVRAVEAVAGRTAAYMSLVLTFACPSALVQFAAGRVDHHNVQNLGATGAVLLLWTLGRNPNLANAAWAGFLAGLAIAIGYEALPIVLVTTAAACIWGILDSGVAAAVRRYVSTFAATAAALFLATTAPASWTHMHCDALSLNMVLLIASGAVAASFALGELRGSRPAARWAVLFAGGTIGAALFAWSEPKCLAGPLGQVPAGLQEIWLVNIAETKSWLSFLHMSPPGAISIALLFALALAAQLTLLKRDRDPAHAFYLVCLAATVPLGLWQLKYMPYASILAVPPIAVFVSRLQGTARISAVTVRALAMTFASQWSLVMIGAVTAPLLLGSAAIEPSPKDLADTCYQKDQLVELGTLPAGLVLAPVDLGSHLLVETPHSVLAAPYHRIGTAILQTHTILSSRTVAEAEQAVRSLGARHIVICPNLSRLVTPIADDPDTFYARLKRDEKLPFLERVPLSQASPFMVWRVTPAAP